MSSQTSYTRRITLYINDKEVKNDIASIQKEFYKANNELKKMTLGSKEYNDQLRKVAGLKSILQEHNKALRETEVVSQSFSEKMQSMPGILGKAATGFSTITKAALAFIATPFGLVVSAIAAIGLGFKALINNSKEFGKAASSLSAITGATGKDLDFLKRKALEISKESTQSATDMLGAFEKIGSALPELLKNGPLLTEVTRNAVALSESTGGKLSIEDAAKAAASALNQFDIPLTESARAVNVLAAGSLAGSAEVNDLTESFKNVGAVASGAGMSLEQTVAALETLGEKTLYGSEAGTKLRGVILKLQDAGLGYASGQFVFSDALNEANAQINSQSTALEKDALAAKFFGAENITAGKILLDNVDTYEELTKAVTGSNAAFEMAIVQQDNLVGSNKKFSNAWENLLLSIEDGSGFFTKLWKGIVDFGTYSINYIVSYFETLGAQFRGYGVFFKNFINQIQEPAVALGKVLKAAFTLKFDELKPAMDELKTALKKMGDEGSLNLNKIIAAEYEQKQASKVATKQVKEQFKTEEQLRLEAEKLKEEQDKKSKKEEDEKNKKLKEEEDRKKKALEKLKDQQEKEIVDLKKNLMDKGMMSDEMNSIIEKKEMDHLIAMLAMRKKMGESTTDIEGQIVDKQLKISEKFQKQKEEINKSMLKLEEEYQKEFADFDKDILEGQNSDNDKELEKAQKQFEDYNKLKEKFQSEEDSNEEKRQKERAEAQEAFKLGIIKSEEDLQKEQTKIDAKYSNDRLEITKQYLIATETLFSGLSNLLQSMKENELAKAGQDEKKKEEIEKKYAKRQQIIAIGLAAIKGALAILEMWNTPTVLPEPAASIYKGAMAVVIGGTTLAEIATIKNQQFREGGFTERSGSDSTPVGVVHANEWVASAPLLRDPDTRRHIDYLEAKQRGLIPSFRTAFINDTIRQRGFQSGGFTGQATGIDTNSTDISDILKRLLIVMDKNSQASEKLAKKKLTVNSQEVFNKQNEYEHGVENSNY